MRAAPARYDFGYALKNSKRSPLIPAGAYMSRRATFRSRSGRCIAETAVEAMGGLHIVKSMPVTRDNLMLMMEV
ncbi:MAG: hypothetical protein R3C40_12300 [Parvularculaceae bacterium]